MKNNQSQSQFFVFFFICKTIASNLTPKYLFFAPILSLTVQKRGGCVQVC